MEYTSNDFAALKREVTRKLLLFGFFAAAYLGGCLAFFVLRWEAACSLFTLFAGAVLIFFIYVYLAPPLRYRSFLKEMQRGQQRVGKGELVRVEQDEDVRDGLPFRPLITLDENGFEHRYYWDVQKPLPQIQPGAKLIVTTYGQNIKKLEIL